MLVLQYNYSPIFYAETLLQIAKQNQTNYSFALAATTNKMQLLQRITYFTSTPNNISNTKKTFVFSAFIIGLLALMFFALHANISFNESVFYPKQGIGLPYFSNTTLPIENNYATIDKKVALLTTAPKNIQPKNKIKKEIVVKPSVTSANEEPILQPVSFKNEDKTTKQIIIEEEQSGNKPSKLSIYNLVNINGKWVLVPQIKISKTQVDSALQQFDSTAPSVIVQENQQ